MFNSRKSCNSARASEPSLYPAIANLARPSGKATLQQSAEPHPVLVLNTNGRLLEFNQAAACCYDLDRVSSLFDLPYDLTTKNWVLSRRCAGQSSAALQSERQDTALLVSLFVYVTNCNRLTLKTAELNWPQAVLALLETNFGLTPAEIAVTRLLVAGAAVRQVAAVRLTSVATVRTQVKSILQKTQCHAVSELTRMVFCACTLPDLTTGALEKHGPVSSRIGLCR